MKQMNKRRIKNVTEVILKKPNQILQYSDSSLIFTYAIIVLRIPSALFIDFSETE